MGVRVGVDVGGTFTKAVGVDLATGALVARSVLPTTHTDPAGVAAGVVAAVADVAGQVGADQIDLVTHSTTQAVNALLEGDVGVVGVIGLGRRPEIAKVRKRTRLDDVELAPGKRLQTRAVFFDVTDGLDTEAMSATLDAMAADGVSAVCVAEAFAPDDASNEQAVSALAASRGLPACASSDLTGLYGLELRAVTAALNASILPIALRTAGYVADGVAAAGVRAPVMVMRGDGGATDLSGFRSAPARTLYSGPAASVAGALRHTGVNDAVVVEVGGTSTNVAAVGRGRPALSYVQVASHGTALRSVDVRVIGVAGGSMLRARRDRVYGVGPRSAHIAGLPYASYAAAGQLAGAVAELVAPRPGDAADHVVLTAADGSRWALTATCAANALGITLPGDHAYAPPDAALDGFEAAARLLRPSARTIAEQMLEACGAAIAELVLTVARDHHLGARPRIVAVGGGAGGLGRHVARLLGCEVEVPSGAEVISSIGDALSLLRAERERTVSATDATLVAALVADVENEVLAAGAAPGSVEVRVEELAEKGTVRAIATGAVGLKSGAVPGRADATDAAIAAAVDAAGGGSVERIGAFHVVVGARALTVLDRYGDVAAELDGEIVLAADAGTLASVVQRRTRARGPVTLRPSAWVIDGVRLMELTTGDVASAAAALVAAGADAVLVGRTIGGG